MAIFSTGLSALTTAQQALDIIGNNIANANTPGYHRQVADLVDQPPDILGNLSFGTGVRLADILRQQSTFLDQAVNQQASASGNINTQLDALNLIQSYLPTGSGSIQNDLQTFFNDLETLAANPANSAQRGVVVNDAATVTSDFNSLAGQLATQKRTLDSQIGSVVNEINRRTAQIADLNGQIQRQTILGNSPNDLIDQRDQLINEIAQRVGVQTVNQPDGVTNVLVGGALLVGGTQPLALATSTDTAGNTIVTVAGNSTPLAIAGGSLAGLLQARNQFVTLYQTQLNTLAKGLIQSLDGLQATGLGLNGPTNLAAGQRGVSSSSVPLSQAGLAFPPQAGSLFITVTNQATGQQTVSQINIDPATQSLQALATAISGVSHLNAVVDGQTNTLRILAQPGFTFDFAGRLPTAPATSAITGTTVPTLGGAYTGSANDVYTFKVVGSGTIGVTSNLTLQVTNAANTVIASLNIGQGYSPGSALTVGKGVTVQLAAGTANANDTFTTPVVGQPDTAGILTALGISGFFSGQDAATIAVQPGLLADPTRLAASQTGQPGDSSNLLRMAAVRDQLALNNGTQTLSDGYAAMIAQVGTQVQQTTQQKSNQDLLGQSLQAQQQSVSGVDPNQELVQMLQFQRSYQVAASYINAVNTSLNDLINIINPAVTG